jgi:hypothetical protein
LVNQPGYKILKKMALSIGSAYTSVPGRTPEEKIAYETHCTIMWGFGMLFRQAESIAKFTESNKDDNDGW